METYSIQVSAVARQFNFNGTTLPDPNPNLPVAEVQQILAQTHPEIATAKVEGPQIEGNIHTFNIVRSVGTKG